MMMVPPSSTANARGIRTAQQTLVPSRYRHCVHTYHGVNPFSKDGKRILYLAFDDIDQPVADVVVQDLKTGNETVVSQSARYDFHTAAKQFWCLDEEFILCKTLDDQGSVCPTLSCADGTGKTQVLTDLAGIGFRHVAADGIHAYGGRGTDDDRGHEVVRVNLQDHSVERLFGVSEVLSVLPDDFAAADEVFVFNHTVCNASQTRLFCKFLRRTPWERDDRGMTYWGAFIVCDLTTGELRSLGRRISGHPAWMPDDLHIVNVMMPLDGVNITRWVVKVNADTGDVARILDTPIEGPGHPLPSPTDPALMLTDAFTPDGRAAMVYLMDLPTSAVCEIARLDHATETQESYQPRRIHRAHPHPAWSHDGQRIVCNYNHNGEHMQLLLLDDFLT